MDQTFRAEIPLGYRQVTDLTTAVSASPPAGTTLILITVETAGARWRDDGTAPTAAIGYPLNTGVELRYTASGMSRLQFIQQQANCVLNMTFYG